MEPRETCKHMMDGREVGGLFKWQIHQLLRIINHVLIVTPQTRRQDLTAGKLKFEANDVI